MLYAMATGTMTMSAEEFDAAIAQAKAEEREACAKIADDYEGWGRTGGSTTITLLRRSAHVRLPQRSD